MPYGPRPGARYSAVAVRSLLNGAPCTVDTYCGIASKQKSPGSGAGFDNNAQITIAVSERFVIVTKGVVMVPAVGGAAHGSTVWINNTNDALTLTDPGSSHGVKFGKVVALAGENNCPAGYMRVDLDAKDSF